MMKKFLLMLISVFLFFNLNMVVKAEEDIDLIYNIKELNVTKNTMQFKGYAFLAHMDNYGDKNLYTYIVVYDEQSGYQGDKYYIDRFESGESISDTYYVKRVTYTGDMNNVYYYDRCYVGVCNYNRDFKRASEGKRLAYCEENCGYFNVEFTVGINLDDIFENMSNKSNLKFKIISKVTPANNVVQVKSKNLGVYNENLKLGDGVIKEIKDGNTNVDTGKYKFLLGDLSNKARLVAKNSNYRTCRTCGTEDYKYFNTGDTFIITERVILSGSKEDYGYKIPSLISYNPAGYEVLGIKKGNTVYSCSVYDGESCKKYYIKETHVSVEGNISIENFTTSKKEPDVKKTTCMETYGIKEDDKAKNESIVCGDTANYEGCIQKTITANIYYPIPSGSSCSGLYGQNGAIEVGGSYYTNVKVNANVLIKQTGSFKFSSVNGDVLAGKIFKFPNITYDNMIEWRFADTYELNGQTVPYFTYDGKMYEKNSSGGCNEVGISVDYFQDIMVLNNEKELVSLRDASYEAIKSQIEKDILNDNKLDNTKVLSYDSNNISTTLESINGEWISDGDSEYEEKTLDGNGKGYIKSFYYDLDDAYIKNGDMAIVEYSKEEKDDSYTYIGDYYYIPLKYPDSTFFPLNISDSNISLVSNMTWNLQGKCEKIFIENNIYKTGKDGNGTLLVRYRPISLDNPFPKKVAVNWQNWWADSTNKNRLTNTYNNGVFYSVSLVEGNSSSGNLGIDNVKSFTYDYNEWRGFDKDIGYGTSKFIKDLITSGLIETPNGKSTSSYCNLGEYNNECDKY